MSDTHQSYEFALNGKTFTHNSKKWGCCTNRHTTTSGNCWGWIEGAPGNVCWSNDSKSFDQYAAIDVCSFHNKWLEEQSPIEIRVMEQRKKLAASWEKMREHEILQKKIQAEIEENEKLLGKLLIERNVKELYAYQSQ